MVSEVFFQREEALKLFKTKKNQNKNNKSEVINHPNIIIHWDLRHQSTSGLNAIESSGGRRMNMTQTLSLRSSWFSWKICLQTIQNNAKMYYKQYYVRVILAENIKVALRMCRKKSLTVWNEWAKAFQVVRIRWISWTIPAFFIPNSKLNISLFAPIISKMFLIKSGRREGVKCTHHNFSVGS